MSPERPIPPPDFVPSQPKNEHFIPTTELTQAIFNACKDGTPDAAVLTKLVLQHITKRHEEGAYALLETELIAFAHFINSYFREDPGIILALPLAIHEKLSRFQEVMMPLREEAQRRQSTTDLAASLSAVFEKIFSPETLNSTLLRTLRDLYTQQKDSETLASYITSYGQQMIERKNHRALIRELLAASLWLKQTITENESYRIITEAIDRLAAQLKAELPHPSQEED